MKEEYILLFIGVLLVLIFGSVNMSTAINVTDFPTDENGNIEVSIQDQYTEIIDLLLLKRLDNLTLVNAANQDDKVITAQTTGYVPLPTNVVCLKDKDGDAFYQGRILSVLSLGGNQYNLTLDTPLDFDYDVADGCSIGDSNWAVDGSITPQTFKVSPQGNLNTTQWDITRMLFLCQGDAVTGPDPIPDGTNFFTMDAVTNGMFIRVNNGQDKNIFNAKSNNDLTLRMYDVNIDKNPNKNGFYTTSARRTFNGADKNGVTIRLNGITNDAIELVVQDDMSVMDKCEAVVQGHVVSP